MTNREWIETLTDEEFSKWSLEVGCGMCVHNPERGFCNNLTESYCIDGIVRWLQMEHKGE